MLSALMRTFSPYIGTRYATDGIGGKRLLILGEAHYGKAGAEYKTYTSDVIRDMAFKKERLPIFARIQHLVLGTRGFLTDTARRDFWERVAFYNFIQVFPGATPKVRPTPTMWSESREPFLQTLAELTPDVLLILGVELKRNLPPIPHGIAACSIQHPSSFGFSYSQLQPIVRSVICQNS